VDLSLERYKAGTVEFMTVIDAGREHFEIEQAWARSKGLVLKTLIRLGR
jgi:outer membrane protein TolC